MTEGVQIPPSVKTTSRKKPTINDHSTTPYRLGRRPGKQGPRPLSSDQGRSNKLATGKPFNTKHPTGNTQRLKLHMRGVGFLLGEQAKKALIGYNPISSRVISARFVAMPFDITSDTYVCTNLVIFRRGYRIILQRGRRSTNTDWASVMGKYGYGDRNERGERLLEFATLHNLFICNTRFEQKPNRKWTWASPNGIHRNMIDLTLIQQRWKTSVINCRTFQSADISTDHSLVLCNIKLRLKKLSNRSQ